MVWHFKHSDTNHMNKYLTGRKCVLFGNIRGRYSCSCLAIVLLSAVSVPHYRPWSENIKWDFPHLFIASYRHCIISHYHKKKSETGTIRYLEKEREAPYSHNLSYIVIVILFCYPLLFISFCA